MGARENAIAEMNARGGRGEPFLFIVDFEMLEPEVLSPAEASRRGILYRIGGACTAPPASRAPGPFRFAPLPVSRVEYRRAFDDVLGEIRSGNTYLLNLTFATAVESDLGLEEIFRRSGPARYRLFYPGRFACFSPEPFVRISGGVISSRPMKGTIDASLPDAEAIILGDAKEAAEHATIVDLIRNDLNAVARDVSVERFRYVERLATNRGDLLQVSSLVTGRLDDGYAGSLGSIVFELLPAGSVTGAPKRRTVEIVRRVEPLPRGHFTGIAGYFDGAALESFVLIRFVEPDGSGGLRFRSGGGITALSDPDAEYEEMIAKVYVPAP